ncbi:SAM-dependent chlorinase/fluorinase [Candidatus Sumerlaeota bacterium]|nr:SAM-dependent chlorinase/fluorinase [Candidatus Sumerlaeota bacterium]
MRRILIAAAIAALIVGCASLPSRVNGRVALFTDYGTEGHYVGALKGAIVQAWPDVVIDDVTHGVPAFDIAGGSFLLASASREWPLGTVFVVVVDPGVGTARRSVALETGNGLIFVGPDNGIFTHVIQEFGLVRIHEITNESLFRPGALSSTFHGRDVYGPLGAHLASGLPLRAVGPALESAVLLRVEEPRIAEGEVNGQVVFTDHYGNVMTNIPAEMLDEMGVEVEDRLIITTDIQMRTVPFVHTYASVPDGSPLALINSQGLLELAVNQGSMAEEIGVATGDMLRIRPEGFPPEGSP